VGLSPGKETLMSLCKSAQEANNVISDEMILMIKEFVGNVVVRSDYDEECPVKTIWGKFEQECAEEVSYEILSTIMDLVKASGGRISWVRGCFKLPEQIERMKGDLCVDREKDQYLKDLGEWYGVMEQNVPENADVARFKMKVKPPSASDHLKKML